MLTSLTATLAPLTAMVLPMTKPVPVSAIVVAAPVTSMPGAMAVSVGWLTAAGGGAVTVGAVGVATIGVGAVGESLSHASVTTAVTTASNERNRAWFSMMRECHTG